MEGLDQNAVQGVEASYSRLLKPQRLEILPTSPDARLIFKHWLVTLKGFIATLPATGNKFLCLINSISHENFEIISDCDTYESALAKLESTYIKPPNAIVARYKLMTRKQENTESIDDYVRILNALSLDGDFKAVSAETNRSESVRDAFIGGINSSYIRTRLLEFPALTLNETIAKARALELAAKDATLYTLHSNSPAAVNEFASPTAAFVQRRCFFCGGDIHKRIYCPANDKKCAKCQKIGHFSKVCRGSKPTDNLNRQTQQNAASSAAVAASTNQNSAFMRARINGTQYSALADSGSSENFLDENVVSENQLNVFPYSGSVSMADTSFSSSIKYSCRANVEVLGRVYKNVQFLVMKNPCARVILGDPFLRKHTTFTINYGGKEPELSICALAALRVSPPKLFSNLDANIKPRACPSRRYNEADKKFISEEISRLLKDDIIEPSQSPWRAQVVVVSKGGKKRLVIDFSTTINKFTKLDAYPLPNIEVLVNSISQYKIYSVLDMKSAYHQIPLDFSDRVYTGFEADGALYQFKRLCFGLTNAVATFQRVMDNLIKDNELTGIYCYVDDVIVCGRDQAEHNSNLKAFIEVVKRYNLTLSKEKSVFNQTTILVLGYEISYRNLKPDPTRLDPIRNIQLPKNGKALQRITGLFAYYSRWIPQYSERIRPLINARIPLNSAAIAAIDDLKNCVIRATKTCIDEKLPFTIETDASDFCISAILSQEGQPVAFYSRTLNPSEVHHHSVEKEAYAIIEGVRKWSHFLKGRFFHIITDQRSVSFMFSHHKSKIKNDKILRWSLELMPYSYNIIHRPGRENAAADTLSRNVCASIPENKLFELHASLCHPGVTRMAHFVKSKNLPYSIEEIKKVTASCKTCAVCKPRFYKTEDNHLIEALKPFDRLSIDFKGPLPSTSGGHKYLLIVIDEYSRYPFAFPCKDMTSSTVIKCLSSIFSLFGLCKHIHSDRGSSFLSIELKTFLIERGISSSKSTPYHPTGNSQCERYVGIIWKSISLALHYHNLDTSKWDLVLDSVLYSLRTLLNTSTGETPHERIFCFQRRSTTGSTLPSWLLNSNRVLFKKHVRRKDELPVEEVDLIDVNPKYAHIRYGNGREESVSITDLAPLPRDSSDPAVSDVNLPAAECPDDSRNEIPTPEVHLEAPSPTMGDTQPPSTKESANEDWPELPQPRRGKTLQNHQPLRRTSRIPKPRVLLDL